MKNEKLWKEHNENHELFNEMVNERIRLIELDPNKYLSDLERLKFKEEIKIVNEKGIILKRNLGILAVREYLICLECHYIFQTFKGDSTSLSISSCDYHKGKVGMKVETENQVFELV